MRKMYENILWWCITHFDGLTVLDALRTHKYVDAAYIGIYYGWERSAFYGGHSPE
jgi:hypothetical protein